MSRARLLFTLTLLAVGLTVSGCGRRGSLDAPGTTTQTKPALLPGEVEADRPPAGLSGRPTPDHPYGNWPYPQRKDVFDVDPTIPPAPKPAKPKRDFILDPLL